MIWPENIASTAAVSVVILNCELFGVTDWLNTPQCSIKSLLQKVGRQYIGKAVVHEPQGQWFDPWYLLAMWAKNRSQIAPFG